MRLPIRFIVHADFIVKNRMETHVFKSGCFPDKSQVPAIAVAQGQNGPPRSKHALPIMRKWVTRASRIYFYDFCSELALCDLRSTRKNNRARQPCQPGKPMHFHPIQQCRHFRNPRAGFAIIAGTGCRTPLFLTGEWDRLRESPSRAYRSQNRRDLPMAVRLGPLVCPPCSGSLARGTPQTGSTLRSKSLHRRLMTSPASAPSGCHSCVSREAGRRGRGFSFPSERGGGRPGTRF